MSGEFGERLYLIEMIIPVKYASVGEESCNQTTSGRVPCSRKLGFPCPTEGLSVSRVIAEQTLMAAGYTRSSLGQQE